MAPAERRTLQNMKRCPTCNHLETDEALKFCRVDGTTLITDSSSINSEAGTAQLGSSLISSEAGKLLGELETQAAKRYVTSACFAIVYGALGDKDKAFTWLEKEVATRASRPPLFSVNPVYDDLRDDPRFQDIVHRISVSKLD